jgi:triacylglycerol lipase
MGPNGWNAFQAGALDAIPVVVIGGSRFTHAGPTNPMVWPNDGIVTRDSAVALHIDDRILPHRRCVIVDDTHSIFVANAAGLPWDDALTWDGRVLDVVRQSLDSADTALQTPNRLGCPTPDAAADR